LTPRYGLVLPIARADGDIGALLAELVEEARAAEAAGFDAVFLPEFHQARGGGVVSPLLVLAALATRTRRIRLGTAVLAGPLHHPVRLAEDAIMLDHLSGGRLVLGLGIGHQRPDFAAYGADHARRAAALDELLGVMERCFAGGPFEADGPRWRLSVAGVTPRPRTLPRPELWLGGHSPAGLRRAARRADRWLADPQRDIATLERLARRYRAECGSAGTTPRVALFREAWIADDRAAAEREWLPHALAVHRLYLNVGAYREALEPWIRDVRGRADWTAERVAPGRFLIGTGEEIRREAADWCARTGADHLAVRLRHPGGPPHPRVLEAIARFGDEVIRSPRG
jgi:alkanesulfonate monooxygenase SsuD/methylene tetrahydromethanopterin reductase-like flavin-dependent oxidoreductase (luciferase family)